MCGLVKLRRFCVTGLIVFLLFPPLPQGSCQDTLPALSRPDLTKRTDTTLQDPLFSKNVFYKETAEAKVGAESIDINRVAFPSRVQDINGEWLWLGEAWVQRSQVMSLEEAMSFYDEEVRKHPDSAKLRLKRAQCQMEANNTSAALEDLNEGIRIDPKNAAIYLTRGVLKAAAGEYREAMDEFTRTIEIEPGYPDAYYYRGLIQEALGDSDLAIKDFDTAISLKPKSADAYCRRGESKQSVGNVSGAMNDFSKAIQIDPMHDYAYFKRGNMKLRFGNMKGAIKDLDNAIAINPFNPQFFFYRGNAHTAIGNFEDAVADFDESIRIDPRQASVFINRGNMKSKLGNEEGAIEDYDFAIAIDPNDADAHYNRGRSKRRLGEYEEAIESLDEANRLDPTDLDTYCERAESKFYVEDYQGAIKDIDKALRLNPKLLYLSNFRFLAEWKLKNNDITSKAPKNETPTEPLDLVILMYNYQGLEHLRRKDYHAAARAFDEAMHLNPNAANAYGDQAFLLSTVKSAKLRDPKKSMELADFGLKLDPSSGYLMNAKACALAANGDFESAMEWQEKSLQDELFANDREPNGGFLAKERLEKWAQHELWYLP